MNDLERSQAQWDNAAMQNSILKVQLHQNDWEDLLKHRFLGPTPRISDSAGLGWLRICISNKFLGKAVADSLGATL